MQGDERKMAARHLAWTRQKVMGFRDILQAPQTHLKPNACLSLSLPSPIKPRDYLYFLQLQQIIQPLKSMVYRINLKEWPRCIAK